MSKLKKEEQEIMELMNTHHCRNPYTSPRRRVQVDFKNFPSKTKQEFKEECDINSIMDRYQATGLIQHVNKYQGRYDELGEPCDFQTAQNIIIEANEAFDSLPSKLRKRFGNNPNEFLEFVQNPANREAMREMGLLNPERPTTAPVIKQELPGSPTGSKTSGSREAADPGSDKPSKT